MSRMRPQKSKNKFTERLPYIDRIVFTIGGFFDGFEKTRVHFSGSQAVLENESLITPSDADPSPNAVLPKSRFLARLSALHIENWNREYMDLGVLDGEQWELEIYFSDGHKSLTIHGSNAYPPKFNSLRRLMAVQG